MSKFTESVHFSLIHKQKSKFSNYKIRSDQKLTDVNIANPQQAQSTFSEINLL